MVDGEIIETMTTPVTRGNETTDHVVTRSISVNEAAAILKQRDTVMKKLTDKNDKKEAKKVRDQLAELLA